MSCQERVARNNLTAPHSAGHGAQSADLSGLRRSFVYALGLDCKEHATSERVKRVSRLSASRQTLR
jgi:hypothetical protein